MTRIARKHGLVEKKVEKKIEEATPWESMINPATENPIDGDDFKEKEISKLKRHEEDYEIRIQQENENNVNKKKRKARSKLEYEALLKQYSETIDKEVLADLKEMKQKYRLNDEEYLDRIRRESRSNARRLDRVAERETKRACLKCRKPGHVVADCPEMQKDNEEGAGICYKCGSTEHSIYKCKVKLEPGQFPFAKCFICHEVGHITKQCPDNPKGLFPNGGACKFCSSVEHYARDCPERQKDNLTLNKNVSVKKIQSYKRGHFEDLSDDDNDFRPQQKVVNVAKKNKVVKF